jgi:hypothetical protein
MGSLDFSSPEIGTNTELDISNRQRLTSRSLTTFTTTADISVGTVFINTIIFRLEEKQQI